MITKQRTPDAIGSRGFGSSAPIGARAEILPPASENVHADVPPGVHSQTMQQMAPFMGTSMLPTGQSITVNMNAPNPNLSFKEWALRGFVGALGRAAQWPFQLVARIIEAIARAAVGILKWAAIVLLFPTLIWLGSQLQHRMAQQHSIEAGASMIAHDARRAAHGVRQGMSDELPADDDASAPPKRR